MTEEKQEKKGRKIAMCGTAPSTRGLIPWNTDWEIWGQADAIHDVKNAARWFDIAPYHRIVSEFKDYHAWLTKQTFPIYMRDHYPAIPTSRPLNFTELAERYGVENMTATVCWMMALANWEHEHGEPVETIGLFGYDMALDAEYCVAPETRALTDDLRWVPVGELKPGDGLIAFDEGPGGGPGNKYAFRQWRHAEVMATQNLKRPCYRIYLDDGTEMVASAEHRWLTDRGDDLIWKPTEKLVTPSHKKNCYTKIVKLTDVWEEDRSWEAGYLAAAFDGEGWLSQFQRKECNGVALNIGYSQKKNAMSEEVLSISGRLGYPVYSMGEQNGCYKYRLAGFRYDLLKFLGTIRPRRLLANFDPQALGTLRQRRSVAVKKIENIGWRDVVGLKTTTGTFIAEGFASHNSFQRPGIKALSWISERVNGIKVFVPKGSDLLIPIIPYPFADDDIEVAKIRARKRDVNHKLALANQRRQELQRQLHDTDMGIAYLNGALEDVNYFERQKVGHYNSAA